MAKKFKTEELSRILSHAHELTPGGDSRDLKACPVGCVNQAAYNNPNISLSYHENLAAAKAFDLSRPKERGTPDRILRLLEKAGCV
jgi:hypothetical protein